jgi:GAF domain-containing protein/HAMP domain-containing protein
LAWIGLAAGMLFALMSLISGPASAAASQYTLLAVTGGLVALLSLVSLGLRQMDRINPAAWLLVAGFSLSLPLISLGVSRLGVFLAVIGVLVLPGAFAQIVSAKHVARALYIGLAAGSLALVIDLFNPGGRVALPVPDFVVIIINLLLLGLSLVWVARSYPSFRLRTKLLVAFLAVSLIPLAVLTYFNIRASRQSLENEANDKLLGSAAQLASQIDTFVQLNLQSVAATARLNDFQDYLSLSAQARGASESEVEARAALAVQAQLDEQNVLSFGILNLQGENILDSSPAFEGLDESDREYFQQVVATTGAYASTLQVGPTGEPSLYFSAPILNHQGQLAGVLRAQWHGRLLQAMVDGAAGQAGPESYAVVFDENLIHLGHTDRPGNMLTALDEMDAATVERLQAAYLLPDMPMEEMVTHLHNPQMAGRLRAVDERGTFATIDPEQPGRLSQAGVVHTETQNWQVVVIQPRDVLFAPAEAQQRTALLLAVVLAAGAAAVALISARLVSRPISDLTSAAMRLAEGQLDVEAPASSDDELGMLGRTFNSMTVRLRSLVAGLEERVSERTVDLERRANQLMVASEVAKDAAGIRDVDRLIQETVERISEQFGYYHAGVFLLDKTGDFAVLRAASSAGGHRMLTRGHQLAVGKVGLVGYVTGTGKPRIARDVGEDAVHFANPDLPDTRSELTLALMAGGKIVGALDVQSTDHDAYDEQDVIALQTMADQLAIAIENARLLGRQTELASDRRRAIDVYRQLTGSLSYDQILADATRLVRTAFNYERVTLGLVEGNDVVVRSASARSQARLPGLGQNAPVGQGLLGRAVSTQRPVRFEGSARDIEAQVDPALGEIVNSLAVPLVTRGRAIGALAVERLEERAFDEDDVELIELLASQTAVSIENARLFEETQQRLRQVDVLYRRQTAETWELLVNARRVQGQENLAEFGDQAVIGQDPDELVGAPISLRGEIIGLLNVLPQRRGEMSDEDLEILQDVADEVAGQLEQLRLVEEIQRRATQLETAAEIARVATGLLDLDPLLKRAVNLIRDRFGFYHVAVYLVEESGHSAFIREASGNLGEALKQTRRRFEIGSRSVIGYVTGTGEYYVAHDTETDPYYKQSNLLPDSRSELAVPLKIGDRIIGALDVHDSGRYAFNEDDIGVLETLADQIAVAVENARLYQTAVARAEREQNVVQITGKIRASRDIDAILQTAVSELRQALGAGRASIRLAAAPTELADNSRPLASNGNPVDGRATSARMDREAEPEANS